MTVPTDYYVHLSSAVARAGEDGHEWTLAEWFQYAIAERLERLVTAVERLDRSTQFSSTQFKGGWQGGRR